MAVDETNSSFPCGSQGAGFLNMCGGNCPKSHHSTWDCTREEEPSSPEKKTITPLPSIRDAPSCLLRLSKDHIWSSVTAHILQVKAHDVRVWFDLRSTRLFTLTILQLKTIALFASSRHRVVLCLFYSTKTSRNGCLILSSKPTLTIHMTLLIFESRLLLVSTETQSTLVNYEALQWDFRS